MTAVRLDEPLQLDGQLDEEIYAEFVPAGGFVQQEPLEGEPATEQTDVWVFYDRENLYVSARCWDSQPDRMVANEMRRDSHNIDRNANFAVILDTFHDRRNGFLFHTNPLGALYDAQVTDETNTNSDWNTVWEVKTGRFAEGWTVEMEIPFKSLRYRQGGTQTWGVNFQRSVQWKNETSHLAPIAAAFRWDGLLKLSQAATLEGIEPPSRSLNLELKPYVTSGLRTDLTADEPYENDLDADVGFDVKYGLTRSLTTDFTYNTDFAQVENDEEQVNLTRFSLFFPEKRDFFLEGQGIFNFGGRETGFWGGHSDTPIMFFSRRIGLEDGVAVPINAGGRITGRAGAYTIGALAMQTESVDGQGIPTTNFGVVRIKRDILRRSNIGFITTYRSESVEADGSNALFGVDGNFTFFQNVNINTYWARSSTSDFDGNDASYRGSFEYGGDRYGVEVERLVVEENFNPEVGFLRRDDFQKSAARLRFSPRVPSIEAIRRFNLEGSIDYFTNGEGLLETREVEVEVGPELENGDDIELTYRNSYENLDEEFEITDGVIIPIGSYSFQSVEASYRLGPQRRVSGHANVGYGSFYTGNRTEVSYGGRIEVTPQFTLEPDISVNWVDLNEGSFVAQVYRIRGNYAFSPRAFVAALVQYNSESAAFSTNIRFRWEYRPGSDLYVVYTDWRDTTLGGFPQLENRSLVVKFTRLFRF
jgi:hypothetical protein